MPRVQMLWPYKIKFSLCQISQQLSPISRPWSLSSPHGNEVEHIPLDYWAFGHSHLLMEMKRNTFHCVTEHLVILISSWKWSGTHSITLLSIWSFSSPHGNEVEHIPLCYWAFGHSHLLMEIKRNTFHCVTEHLVILISSWKWRGTHSIVLLSIWSFSSPHGNEEEHIPLSYWTFGHSHLLMERKCNTFH